MYRQPKLNASHPLQRLPMPIKLQLSRAYWIARDITDYLAEITGKLPLHSLRLFLYRYLLRVQIGHRASVHRGCRLYHPSRIKIGNHSVINRDVLLDGRLGLVIGNNVSISEGVMIFTLEHDLASPTFDNGGAPVKVDDYVFIGARAIILPGVSVGRGVAVGAGSTVTRDVEPYTIVAGAPAKPIGQRRQDLAYQLDYRKLLG
jgi:acetyltransferase-like isoleucine patch superfamily enzyme